VWSDQAEVELGLGAQAQFRQRPVVALVDAVAREVPEIRYVGWDFAVTPMGAAVIEGNYNTGVFQLKPSVTGVREGLLPLYRSVIGF